MFLLCSDGLTNYVADDELCAQLVKQDALEDKVGRLVGTALARGGTDNITAIVVSVEDGDVS